MVTDCELGGNNMHQIYITATTYAIQFNNAVVGDLNHAIKFWVLHLDKLQKLNIYTQCRFPKFNKNVPTDHALVARTWT